MLSGRQQSLAGKSSLTGWNGDRSIHVSIRSRFGHRLPRQYGSVGYRGECVTLTPRGAGPSSGFRCLIWPRNGIIARPNSGSDCSEGWLPVNPHCRPFPASHQGKWHGAEGQNAVANRHFPSKSPLI